MIHLEILRRLATDDAQMLGLTGSEIDALKAGVDAIKAIAQFHNCENELCGVFAGSGDIGFESLCGNCSSAIYTALKTMYGT